MEGIFEQIGRIFDPALYYSVEAGFTESDRKHERYNHGWPKKMGYPAEPAEYADYTIDELIDCLRVRMEHAEVGDYIEVDMGIAILSGRAVLDSEEYDAGDGYLNPPYYSRTLRLEDVEIVEEDGARRTGEEGIISQIIF